MIVTHVEELNYVGDHHYLHRKVRLVRVGLQIPFRGKEPCAAVGAANCNEERDLKSFGLEDWEVVDSHIGSC